ncbi:MAG: hypothetical protein HY921_06860 [Elusimicrobia bacterium]|nr:hypothetical protein [Elusimicrobiota bacterium]
MRSRTLMFLVCIAAGASKPNARASQTDLSAMRQLISSSPLTFAPQSSAAGKPAPLRMPGALLSASSLVDGQGLSVAAVGQYQWIQTQTYGEVKARFDAAETGSMPNAYHQKSSDASVDVDMHVVGLPINARHNHVHSVNYPGDGALEGYSWLSLRNTGGGLMVRVNQRTKLYYEGFNFDWSVNYEAEAVFKQGSWKEYQAGKTVVIELTEAGQKALDKARRQEQIDVMAHIESKIKRDLASVGVRFDGWTVTIASQGPMRLTGSKKRLFMTIPPAVIRLEAVLDARGN